MKQYVYIAAASLLIAGFVVCSWALRGPKVHNRVYFLAIMVFVGILFMRIGLGKFLAIINLTRGE